MAENSPPAGAGRNTVGPTVASAVSTAGPAAVPAPRPGYPQPSSAGRSANMRANRRADTKPELALRRALPGRGLRYCKEFAVGGVGGVPVGPGIMFPARQGSRLREGLFR